MLKRSLVIILVASRHNSYRALCRYDNEQSMCQIADWLQARHEQGLAATDSLPLLRSGSDKVTDLIVLCFQASDVPNLMRRCSF